MSYNWDEQKVKQLLRDRNLTQEDLAEITGYSTGTISRTLKLHQPLNDQFAARVALALNIPLQTLLHDAPVTV